MASQLLSVPRIRRVINLSSCDIAVNLSLSHSQNSYYHGIGDESGTKAQVSKGRGKDEKGGDGWKGKKLKRRGLSAKNGSLATHHLNRFLHKLQESPSRCIFRKVKAFYSKMASASSSSSNRLGNEIMAVEPYFSMPVIPITTTC